MCLNNILVFALEAVQEHTFSRPRFGSFLLRVLFFVEPSPPAVLRLGGLRGLEDAADRRAPPARRSVAIISGYSTPLAMHADVLSGPGRGCTPAPPFSCAVWTRQHSKELRHMAAAFILDTGCILVEQKYVFNNGHEKKKAKLAAEPANDGWRSAPFIDCAPEPSANRAIYRRAGRPTEKMSLWDLCASVDQVCAATHTKPTHRAAWRHLPTVF